MRPPEIQRDAALDPTLGEEARKQEPLDPGHTNAIKAWSRFRFVRAGWFTPQEAINFID
jgi:hypothetical protein